MAPHLRTRYDDMKLRLFLRDYERHIEQLARALETGDSGWVANYGEWLVPVYRRREVPMKDVATLLLGLREAAATVLTPDEARAADEHLKMWRARLEHHRRLPGDHPGNPVVRFFWKGAGILDEEIV